MAIIKFKDNDNTWKAVDKELIMAIKNRLRCDKNLSDIIDRTKARENLGLIGDVTTHHHDGRYIPIIGETKALIQSIRDEFESFKGQEKSNNDSLRSSINENSKLIEHNAGNTREEIEALRRTMLKRGMILDWYGTPDTVPEGWHICDGTYGTPDLRDKFVLGAGGKYPLNGAGGVASFRLTVDMIPEHRHTIFAAGSTDSDAHGDIHGAVQTIPDGITGTVITNGVYNEESPTGNGAGGGGRQRTNTGERPDSPYKRGGGGANSNGGVSSRSEGYEKQVAINNLPPYYALYKIMKL